MSLVTNEEVKNFLGFDNNDSFDSVLNLITPLAEARLFRILNIDGLETKDYEEYAPLISFNILNCKNFPVTSIKEIAGETVNRDLWEEYMISKNKVTVLNGSLEDIAKDGRIKIKYEAWYGIDEMPQDLKLALLLLIAGLFNVKEKMGVVSCSAVRESVQMRDSVEAGTFTDIVKNRKKKTLVII